MPILDEFTDSNGESIGITFKDCGVNADATVTSVTPSTLVLGQDNAFTGAGKNTKHVTGGTFKISMTGVGGISLLGKCTGDLAQSAQCTIGLGPVHIGKLTYSGMSFPQEPGTLTLPDITSISLPKNLPKFALTTTTKLEVTDSDGAQMICLEIFSKAQ